MDFAKESGRRLAKSRKSIGLSQEKLSKKIDGILSASRIANYEQGIRLLKSQEARILAAALDVSPAYLMCLDQEDEMTDEQRDLLRDWGALPERDRKDYARRIKVLALAYREAVPDERVPELKASAKKSKKPVK